MNPLLTKAWEYESKSGLIPSLVKFRGEAFHKQFGAIFLARG